MTTGTDELNIDAPAVDEPEMVFSEVTGWDADASDVIEDWEEMCLSVLNDAPKLTHQQRAFLEQTIGDALKNEHEEAKDIGPTINEIAPGSRWKHYAGGEYEVICVGLAESDFTTQMVVYKSRNDGGIWVRPVSSWLETVDGKPRFKLEES